MGIPAAQAHAAALAPAETQLAAIEEGHAFFLSNVKTGKRLAVAKGSRKAGAEVKLAKAKASKAQKFRFVKKGSSYLLQNVRSCKYVGISKGRLC